ncbi:MAG: 30S ribosomal protein S3ae [Methermicoccaceae archaeon]
MAKGVGKRASSWASKKWYQIMAPPEFGEKPVGESCADAPSKMIGRTIEVSLGELGGDITNQNIKLMFKVSEVAGESARTRFMGYTLTRDYLRSLIKRRTTKVDANIKVNTRDGRTLRLKPSCFTVRRARTSHIKTLRKLMEDVVRKRAEELTLQNLIEEMISGKLAYQIYKEAKHVYPLRKVEIRKSQILD